MPLEQNKHAIFSRNYSFKQNSNKKMRSFETESQITSSQRQETFEIEQKQETSAVRQLLEINDWQKEDWKDRTFDNDDISVEKSKKKSQISNNHQKSRFFIDTIEKYKIQPQAQQIWIDSGLQKIFIKRQSFERQNYTQRKLKTKKTENSQKSDYKKVNRQNIFQNNSHFLNRTNYWKNLKKEQKSIEIIQKHKLTKSSRNHEFFHKSYQKTEPKRQIPEQIQFQRSKSSFEKNNRDRILQKQVKSQFLAKPILILPNKAITVRKMLEKIKTNQKIDLSNIQNSQNKKRNIRFKSNRQPFQSTQSKNFQLKNFTPFRIQQERKIQYSLKKLEQLIRKNPQLNNQLQDIDYKYLEKPTYCSWVERNKDKIKIKKNYPLTVKPLKLLNQ